VAKETLTEAPFTSEADEEFFGAIGRLTISWGHLELGLDAMVEILYRGCEGNLIEPEMPRNLQRKITFLRKAVKKLPIGEAALRQYSKSELCTLQSYRPSVSSRFFRLP
jgi:hypothetical protein